MAHMQNRFVWYDLMAHDVDGAKHFYGKVMGWTFTDGDNPQLPYTIINAGTVGVGGIMAFRDSDSTSIPPFWSGYIHVADVDGSIKAIEQRGGQLFRGPVDVPGMVRFAIMLDPQGAMFNILTPLSDESRTGVADNSPGHVGWHELHADQPDSAWDFYAGLFHWTKGAALDMRAMGTYQIFRIDGIDKGAVMKRQPMLPQPSWLFYFNVDGIDAAITRINKAGGKVTMGPHQVPGGRWIAMALDPQGGAFQLLSTTR